MTPSTKEVDLDDLLCPLVVVDPYPKEVTKEPIASGNHTKKENNLFINKMSYTSGSTCPPDTESFEEFNRQELLLHLATRQILKKSLTAGRTKLLIVFKRSLRIKISRYS